MVPYRTGISSRIQIGLPRESLWVTFYPPKHLWTLPSTFAPEYLVINQHSQWRSLLYHPFRPRPFNPRPATHRPVTTIRSVHTAQHPQNSRRQNREYTRTVSMPWILVVVQNARSTKRRSSSHDAGMSWISHMKTQLTWSEDNSNAMSNEWLWIMGDGFVLIGLFIFYSGLKHTGYDQSLSSRFRAKK